MTAIKSREFKHIFRKNAMLRELFLECVAVQCVLLFRAILGSRHSDDAEHIVGGTIQEAAIHFSKTAQEDYHSVRNQIADRWWYLVQQHREWRYKESLDALKDSTLAVHRKRVCELLSINSFAVGAARMEAGESAIILSILESVMYEEQIERDAPLILFNKACWEKSSGGSE